MTRAAPTPSNGKLGAWTKLYSSVFAQLMLGPVTSSEQEERFGALRDELRDFTKEQVREMAGYAAEYFVERANPRPADLPRAKHDTLLREAFDYARKRIAEQY